MTTMFTRNEKPASPASGAKTQTPEKVEPPAPPKPEASRVQATAQPLATMGAPRMSSVSVISKALKITGQLESSEDIQIDGTVEGDVRAVSVTVGTSARVKGTVYGETVELAGTVEGKIEAKKVVLTSTAHMSGDVIHQDITIASGAFIDGHCRPEFGKNEIKPVQPVHKPVTAVSEKVSSAGS
jgi:cytoskeletal protein CcmA (bactofilin family)